jgi:hypothetical protein
MSGTAAGTSVGVLGGYGAVGGSVARLLADRGVGPLRIGGRRAEEARRFVADQLKGSAESVAVEVTDPESLAAFCRGCRLVVNCAGPSYRLLDTVARAAVQAGADYVDPGGDTPVYNRLAGLDLARLGRVAVLTAGLMPGLTALLPRWLAGRVFTRVRRLTGYVGLVDHLTPAGAGDYLLSLGGGHGESRAAWRDGRLVPRALEPLTQVELPFFPGRVNAHPYLSTETQRLARDLRLEEVRWYNVFDGGGQMMAALSRLQGAMAGDADLDAAAAQLIRAAELDLFGRRPYQLLVFQLEGTGASGELTRSLVLRASDTSELTGSIAAATVRGVLHEEITPGVHYAADALEPGTVVRSLPGLPAVTTFEFIEGAAVGVEAIEEAVL